MCYNSPVERERTVGVLGGLGPETTSKFNLAVTEKYLLLDPAKRPQILSWYVGMDLNLEREFVEHGTSGEKYIPYLLDGAERLQKGGADFLVIPCNSVHIYLEQVRMGVGIPVLSIVEETERYLSNKNTNTVGILATPITVQSRLYHEPLEQNGIKIINPNEDEQKLLGIIIDRLVENKDTEDDKREVLKIMDALLKRGTSSILLACTDFQLIVPKNPNIFDTMDILANSTARKLIE